MRVLLDTHILLWAAADPGRLPPLFRERLESPDNDVLFSAASIWELAIKVQIGRISLSVAPGEIARTAVQRGFVELPITAAHAAGVGRLPLHHRDPFDRILIAQSIHEPARLLTVDRILGRYSDLVDVAP
ncbi:type II toxin-antitoxin system VapC family toxin [Candidatus Fermentibacteria bacterium]|nr:type II toxin-antitoxin system VapC family toxin [Candidatus Fermentibacteria bacterium]